jgi:hypothetical protein
MRRARRAMPTDADYRYVRELLERIDGLEKERERVSEIKAWARSRITACREQERKFADAWPESKGKGPPQALVEAWTERRALQAVLEQLDAEAAPTGGTAEGSGHG